MSDEELRALAEAATPGPWEWADPVGLNILRLRGNDPDAAFIGAANPTAVLALLDELDALRAQVERVRALADEFDEGHWRGAARDIRDALDGPQ